MENDENAEMKILTVKYPSMNVNHVGQKLQGQELQGDNLHHLPFQCSKFADLIRIGLGREIFVSSQT